MPTHCCVPECTKKGYQEDDGTKVSYFKFTTENVMKKKWLHAIRRDEGKHFKVTENTKICSRHFREGDIKKSLAGKNELRDGVVPSVFPWIRTSPRKRKNPAERNFELTASKRSASRKLSSSAVSVEELTSEVVPDLPDCSLKVEDETQTDFTEQEAYLREIIDNNRKMIHKLEQELQELKRQLQDAQRQNDVLNKRLFNFENCKSKDSNAAFYTGFQSWDTFMAVFEYLDPGERGENISYWRSTTENNSDYSEDYLLTKKGRARSLRPIDEFFMVMCRLRQGFLEDHLAQLFNVSASTVSRIIITWDNFMFFKFGQINIWPSRKVIDTTMPEAFKGKYKSTRVIIDCTEVRCQMPSSLQLNGELFSSYKNHTTLKGLVGISPGGELSYIHKPTVHRLYLRSRNCQKEWIFRSTI